MIDWMAHWPEWVGVPIGATICLVAFVIMKKRMEAMERNIITPADTARITKAASNKADERAVLAARAVLAMLTDSFNRFRPSIDGVLEAMNEFSTALRNEGVHSLTWRRILTELDELTEENPEGKQK